MRIEECDTLPKLKRFLQNRVDDGEISPELFKDAVSRGLKLGLSDVRLADAMQVSTGTIGRYSAGKVAPHPLVRKVAFEEMGKLIEA